MTILDYSGQAPRVTDDAGIIATLTRKGWIARPEPPSYDPQTQQVAWDGAQWVVSVLPPPPVPESVPAHHLRRALRAANKLSVYKAFVSALTDEDAKDYWETANPIKRNSRYMPALRAALSITNSKLDDIFIVAGNMADT